MTHEFYNKYQVKIKTGEELQDIIGPFPREKTVMMCAATRGAAVVNAAVALAMGAQPRWGAPKN